MEEQWKFICDKNNANREFIPSSCVWYSILIFTKPSILYNDWKLDPNDQMSK